MDNEIKELLLQIQTEIKDIKDRVEKIEKNQKQVAEAENKNWHMLADKLGQYDLILHKVFGKK
jgi:DNA repair exonuclease SbcCD ATPase subunit